MLDILNKIASVTGYDIDWGEIVKRLPGTEHPKHFDIAEESTIFSSVTYLNDDFTGGETEFLHQHKRLTPKRGTVVIWPAAWTHQHRGNPPLEGTKYILTGWYINCPL